MKRFIIQRICLVYSGIFLLLLSCQTIPVEKADKVISSVETVSAEAAAQKSVSEILGSVERALSSQQGLQRDIDDRDWLMAEINTRADADQLMVSLIYEDLYYRGWDDETKRIFLNSLTGRLMQGDPDGTLNAQRIETLRELDYLIKQSQLLKDSPWMVRDFYDERSEFSYWYLLYIGRSFDREWQKNTVLPVMRSLIREDRITAASYIWLNKPESLASMENEVQSAGYPWNRILHLLNMARYIRAEMNRLFPAESPDPRPEGMLF